MLDEESLVAELRLPGEQMFGSKFAGKLDSLRLQLASLKEQLADPKSGVRALDVLDAEEQLKEFIAEHDNAGVYKTERFGADLAREIMEQDDLSKDFDGSMRLTESDQRVRVMQISLTELDRLNDPSEGGSHEAGNQALLMTARLIEETIRQTLQQEGVDDGLDQAYDLYRLLGSDFAVRLHVPSTVVDPDGFMRRLETAIMAQSLDVLPGKDRAPITAASIGFHQAKELLSRIHQHLPLTSEQDRRRWFIEVIKRSTEYHSEVRRLEENLRRVFSKKKNEDLDAKSFFEKYIAKRFEQTPFAQFDAFNVTWTEAQFEDHARDVVAQIVSDQFGRERQLDDQAETLMLEAVAARPLRIVATTPRSEASNSHEQTASAGELAKRQARTRGNDELLAFRRQMEAVRTNADDVGKLQQVVDRYGKIPSDVTIDWDDPIDVQKIKEIMERKFVVTQHAHDRLTGLPNRGTFYRELDHMHQEAEKRGENPRLLFIDLAFLKYFNQQGGREVGNFAIQQAAEILEGALVEAGVANANVYRYAGDEFTVLFSGSDDDEQKIMAAIESVRLKNGKIPRTERSSAAYDPEYLQFNIGGATREESMRVAEEFKRAGIIDAARFDTDAMYRRKQLMEIQTKLADLGIEAQKAESRIEFIFSKFSDPTFSEPTSSVRVQTESLIRYSQKAVFGWTMDQLLTLHTRVAAGEITLRDVVQQQIVLQREQGKDRRTLTDLVIESFVQERHLRGHITQLEARVIEQAGTNMLLQKQIDDLRTRLDGIIAARATLQAVDRDPV